MYRKLTYEELCELKSGFFETLSGIIASERFPTLKDYLNAYKKQGPEVYHFARQGCIRRTIFHADSDEVTFLDEGEQIEFHADRGMLAKLTQILKDPKKIAQQKRDAFSIEQQLMQKFESGELDTIGGKDYLVYDIETSYGTNDIRQNVFYIGYAYIVSKGKGAYRLISQESLSKFLEYLVEFDGYIIGYNSLAFDNPVTVSQGLQFANDQSDDEEYARLLAILNKKSLDLFQFIRGLTGKRIGLNKLSRSLVGLGKTLESGKEAQELREAHQDGNTKAMTTLKEYCKNDVTMTFLVLWYILAYQELGREEERYTFSLEEFLSGSNKENRFLFPGEEQSQPETMFS